MDPIKYLRLGLANSNKKKGEIQNQFSDLLPSPSGKGLWRCWTLSRVTGARKQSIIRLIKSVTLESKSLLLLKGPTLGLYQ